MAANLLKPFENQTKTFYLKWSGFQMIGTKATA